MKKSIFFLCFVFACSACTTVNYVEKTAEKTPRKPKNIVLMIGDGMGLTQISAGLYMNSDRLNLEQFPVVGLHKSYSADDLITDSAAGATAFASGVKTYNAAIGMTKDTQPIRTILEQAEQRGMATGLVATCAITHATPAAFIAHQKHRDRYEAIAADFLATDVDYIVGGGKKFFDQRTSDRRNLLKEMEAKGYAVGDFTQQRYEASQETKGKKFAFFTAADHPSKASEGRTYLPAASARTVKFLKERSAGKGFFAMIEGSQIDWGGHANDSDFIISEMLDFNRAIGEVLAWARKDGETLVIVTADHETGGYAILTGSKMDSLVTGFNTKNHTGTLIPVFAFGPGAAAFAGIYQNTAIYDKMAALLGFK